MRWVCRCPGVLLVDLGVRGSLGRNWERKQFVELSVMKRTSLVCEVSHDSYLRCCGWVTSLVLKALFQHQC